ncbi:MAG: DUF5709 domain-containing protein [Mycobacteriales bacterium]|nr:DUF5709 domain-containing protein [Frankia sp.]
MTSRITEPPSPYEDEGVPDLDNPVPGKRAAGDTQDEMLPARDRPVASTDFGTTAAEEREGESLEGRIRREEPDVTAESDEVYDADAVLADDAAADPFRGDLGSVGRLVEDDEGARADETKEALAHDVGTDLGGFSAEEAAMHIVEES